VSRGGRREGGERSEEGERRDGRGEGRGQEGGRREEVEGGKARRGEWGYECHIPTRVSCLQCMVYSA
jgi:hypothetical protein